MTRPMTGPAALAAWDQQRRRWAAIWPLNNGPGAWPAPTVAARLDLRDRIAAALDEAAPGRYAVQAVGAGLVEQVWRCCEKVVWFGGE